MTGRGITILLLFFINRIVLSKPSNPRANILNVSKEPPSPLAFWPMKQSLHDDYQAHGRRYAVISDGQLNFPGVDNQITYGYISVSVSRCVTISNNDGFLNGNDAMTWLFYIRITSSQTATLLQYYGMSSHSGFTFGVASNKLFISYRDDTNSAHYSTSDFNIPADGSWIFVGFTFNKMWIANDHIDLLYFTHSVQKSTYGMGTSERTVDAYGDIIIGRNWDGSQQFNGDIACMQYFNTSLLGGTLGDSINLCDPSQGEFPGDHTVRENNLVEVTTGVTTTDVSCLVCSFSEWGPWNDCSKSCGGGVRMRSRNICCPVELSMTECLINYCPLVTYNDLQQSQTCNSICSNGGTYFSSCLCQPGWSGPCCEKPMKCSGDPEIPKNSRLVVQGYQYTNQSAVVCDIGYAVTSGDPIRYCNSTGQWNGTKPICSLTSWSYSPMEGHGSFSHLLMDKSSLSKRQRSLKSVYEDRPSKVIIGTAGIIIICLIVFYFIFMDMMTICKNLKFARK